MGVIFAVEEIFANFSKICENKFPQNYFHSEIIISIPKCAKINSCEKYLHLRCTARFNKLEVIFAVEEFFANFSKIHKNKFQQNYFYLEMCENKFLQKIVFPTEKFRNFQNPKNSFKRSKFMKNEIRKNILRAGFA
jgi:hypothetical protein